MFKTDVHKLIDSYRVNSDDDNKRTHNVLSQASINCKSGKWYVPTDKYSVFLNKIFDMLNVNKHCELHFLEVPNNGYNMVKIDIDLRFDATEDELKNKMCIKRRYTDELIDLLINVIATHLIDIIDIPDNYKIYIQEKTKPRILYQEKKIKDGIHIIIPDIVMSNKALYYLREQMIDNINLEEILKEIENISELSDVIDKRIIYPNAWYIYGCGKPEDKIDVYKVTKIYKIIKDIKNKNDYDIKMVQSNNTIKDYIFMFSNFEKKENANYIIDLENNDKYNNDKNINFLGKENAALYREFTQDKGNFRCASTLTLEEIKPYLNCLKKKRVDDYDDWARIGLSLFNMDHRNYELWRKWSMQSIKYDENACFKKWHKEFPKAGKYNMGFNKIKEMSKTDNYDKFNQIVNLNRKHFFLRWLQSHMDEKDIHFKGLSISTITTNIHTYISDYANFYVACALPGGISAVYYKFNRHRWTKDEGANKVYTLLSTTVRNELTEIFNELKAKLLAIEHLENEQAKAQSKNHGGGNYNGDDNSETSNQRYMVDNRAQNVNHEKMAEETKVKMYTKLQSEKCSAIILYLDKPANKKTIIEDLSQKCYDEEFYKKLDDNHNVFVCSNGVLDLEMCIFRDGQPSDMMTMSSNVQFPNNIDSVDAQEYMCSIQDWLDKIFPDDDVQTYVLNCFACKLSGKLFGEKFHIFTGSGANGKSQFFKFIKEVFGDYYQQADNSLLNTPKRDANAASPAVAQLKSKRIIVLTEPKNNLPFESDKVKELISGDPLTCRHLNKDPIQFIPQYAMFLQCNDIPRNESTDDGFWRKIFIVPCDSKFITKDDDLYKLNDNNKFPNHYKGQDQSHLYKDWAPYFLYLLFERYKELKQNNFNYQVPNKMKIATRQYQEEASTYTQFFNDKIEEAPGYKVDSITLYSEFQNFVGRDFKTQKSTFLKQMERVIGKPKGKNKEFYGFRIYGTSGEPIDIINANDNIDDNDF